MVANRVAIVVIILFFFELDMDEGFYASSADWARVVLHAYDLAAALAKA